MTAPLITQAVPADRDRVISTFVAAFATDPVLRHLFPGASYEELAPAFAGHLFDRRVTAGTVWLADGGAAVAMWDPPGPGESWPPAASYLPAEAAARVDAYDAVIHPHMPVTPHWYLGVLACDPRFAGRRLGRAVMQPGLRRAAADGLPAYLETGTTVNVGIYQRSGWTVDKHITTGALTAWILRHDGIPVT
ncbi:GNAT family N-acetyltransferase [Catenuloplanes atrovinosus]|uniref:GNAT superfamily N-acetyltransferase n=1 Tax=Catenuloplanes atrovinosus TaxID=137266 RepID=A0AAE3YLX6_9ACTN|nr:GNAT family N-acetyltransferase [Catenuloplanes atrovinosus]MDR7275945.1 GNAT superfamily N-acetyltransferase [Catenuloplanes atrovinosus]